MTLFSNPNGVHHLLFLNACSKDKLKMSISEVKLAVGIDGSLILPFLFGSRKLCLFLA